MSKDYDIAKTGGTCTRCGKDLAPQQEFIATVRDLGEVLQREDYCDECWENRDRTDSPGVLAMWRGRVPRPEEKRKLFVDDELLINFFERLADEESETKQAFRYVLALVLMRKKLIVYDRTERQDDGTEIWKMHLRGGDQTYLVIDPKMDEEKIAQVSADLGQILEGEL
jgi:hypothetical protein